jgi:dipeptidyl aminopeptidase/acylaminoacyl peptidase
MRSYHSAADRHICRLVGRALAQIGRFNTPIFLMGATDDVDFEQTMFFNGMRSAGKNITYAAYVGDSHVSSEKNKADYWWRVLEYLKKC